MVNNRIVDKLIALRFGFNVVSIFEVVVIFGVDFNIKRGVENPIQNFAKNYIKKQIKVLLKVNFHQNNSFVVENDIFCCLKVEAIT